MFITLMLQLQVELIYSILLYIQLASLIYNNILEFIAFIVLII